MIIRPKKLKNTNYSLLNKSRNFKMKPKLRKFKMLRKKWRLSLKSKSK